MKCPPLKVGGATRKHRGEQLSVRSQEPESFYEMVKFVKAERMR